MHLAVPKHDVFVIIVKNSIGWLHRPNYLEYIHNNIVSIYCQFQTVCLPQVIILNFMSQLKKYTKEIAS